MTDNELSGQERTDNAPATNEKRAEWEQFTIIVLGGRGGGYVNVRNDSHDNPNEHIHSVHVANGQADSCSCEHATYRNAHCKHQVAVENRPLIVSSADAASASTTTTGQQVATDGGTQQVAHTDASNTETDDTQTDANDDDEKRPQTDHWGHEVKYFDDEVVGAGEKRECQSCGSRFEVAMIAATEDNSRNWEEFYECQQCGVRGSFRFYGERDTREWTGRIAYPD